MKHILVLALILALISSCRKSVRDEDRDTKSAQDFALADICFNDLSNLLTEVIANESGLRSTGLLECATVTVDTLAFPMTVTIDFGTGCQSTYDGRTRSGIIYATFTGKYRDSLTVITITPDNYYLNGRKIEGTKIISNKGHNANGNLWYTIEINDAIITDYTENWTITFESDRIREWISGEGTSVLTDDLYEISGTMDGTGRTGNHFTATTTTDVTVKLDCAWAVSGVIEVQPDNVSPRIIDFGNGSCDNDATVTVNGFVIDVEMQ
jgi:hypothetical protein